MTSITKALIYCRVSTKGQEDALGSQEHRCRAYAEEKEYIVERTFPDSYSGGGNFMHRPAMVELLKYLEEHRNEKYVVIFDDLKRFARDTIFHWNLRHALTERGATVECLNFKFEDSPEGTFIETVIAAQGQLEREQNRRQTLQKTKARLERGYWPFYPPPGYTSERSKIHGKLLVPKEPEASIIREALEGFASNRFPNQVDVQRFLQSRRFLQKDTFYWEQVRRLLERVIYAGYIEYPPWSITRRSGHHQALVSLETYEKVQERLRGSTISYSRQDIREDFPLRGLIQCRSCDHLLTASWTKGRSQRYPYYHCIIKTCAAYGKSIRAQDLERDFLKILRSARPNSTAIALAEAVCLDLWNRRAAKKETPRAAFQNEIEEINSRFASLQMRLIKTDSDIAADAYEKELVTLNNRRLLLQELIAREQQEPEDFGTALSTVLRFLKDPYLSWQNGRLTSRRLVYKLVFEAPLLYDRNRGFGTAEIRHKLTAFQHFWPSHSCDVQMIEDNWNQIEEFVWEAYKLIQESEDDTNEKVG